MHKNQISQIVIMSRKHKFI